MHARSVFLGLAFGVPIGALATWLAPSATAPSPSTLVPPTAPPAPGPVAQVRTRGLESAGPSDPLTSPGACDAELTSLRADIAFLERQVALLGGGWADWPDTVPEPVTEDGARAIIEASLDAEVTLERMECEEFPCVAVFRYPDGAPGDSRYLASVRDALAEAGAATSTSVQSNPYATWGAITIAPPDLDVDVRRRLDQRMKELQEELLEASLPDGTYLREP